MGVAGALAVLALGPVHAQTIADYSRVQRAALEAAMAQAAARAIAGPGGGAASAAQPTLPAAPPLPSADAALRRGGGEPGLRVGGVFASASRTLAEVAVDGNPYLLAEGQAVPGTAWRVETVAVDRVVLHQVAPAAGETGHETRRVFALPSLR